MTPSPMGNWIAAWLLKKGVTKEILMQIEFRTTANSSSYVDVIKKLKEISSESDLKKLTFELVALMYADDNFADEEEKLLRCVQEYFGFSSHLMGELVFVSRHTLLSYRMIENVVKN